MPDASKGTYPGWVQRKAVTLAKRDQKRGGVGNVQQYRLAIHEAVLASQGHDHWTGEWLAEVHEFLADAMLAIVVVHIGTIALMSLIRRRNQALPMFKRGNRLFVAIADPTNTRCRLWGRIYPAAKRVGAAGRR